MGSPLTRTASVLRAVTDELQARRLTIDADSSITSIRLEVYLTPDGEVREIGYFFQARTKPSNGVVWDAGGPRERGR